MGAIPKDDLRIQHAMFEIAPSNARFPSFQPFFPICRNPSLGLVTKAKACKGAGQKASSRVTSHVLGNEKECKGMNPHIPK
jgi:hypothetical protein